MELPDQDTPLVYGFSKPHQVGTVCGNPCKQCGGDMAVMTAAGPTPIEPVPLYIVREATWEEYVVSVVANGGGAHLSQPHERVYYVVSTD